jgi:ABC-2 type transport system permease protein
VKRYAVTLGRFWFSAVAAEMEYRLNFVAAAITSGVGLIGSLFTLSLFFRVPGGELGGWTWEQALLVMGLFTLMQGVSAMLLGPNLNRLVGHVQAGTLDFVLLKPIDSQFWISLRTISPWGMPDLLAGLGVLGYAAWRLQLPWTAVLTGLLPGVAAVAVLYSLWFILAATSIWFVKVGNVTHVLSSFLEAGRYPLSAYPLVLRVVFTLIVPVAFITTVPAQAMLGQASLRWLGAAAVLAVVLFAVARAFWRFALRHYTSASS